MNYIGSKFSLLPFIQEVFDRETYGHSVNNVTDMFAGTSAVRSTF